MPDLSLKGLRQRIETEKKGYTINLNHSSLLDLKNIIDNMYSVRSASNGVRCAVHIGDSYTGKLSVGDMNNSLNILTSCTCDSQIENGIACTCNTRTACDCNGRTASTSDVLCSSRTADGSCYSYSSSCGSNCNCNGRTPSACECQSNLDVQTTGYSYVPGSIGVCGCNSQYPNSVCNCNGVNTADYFCSCNGIYYYNCTCNSRTPESCDCQGRTTSSSCSCYSRGDACQCNTRTATSSDCTSYVGADCPSRTACNCNSVKIFE